MSPELAPEEIAAALDAVATDVLGSAGIHAPPVDCLHLARALGITVAVDDSQPGRARYVRLCGRRSGPARPAILLSGEPRGERRHWAIAHEIGEHAAHRVFDRLGIEPCETARNARETVASQLAGRLLLPTRWFVPDAEECRWDLLAMKLRYATASHELIARRMLECPPPVIISIFDHGELWFRRGNLAGRAAPLSTVELECWRAVHTLGLARQEWEATRTIQGWPVHEEGWKREILRTEAAEFGADF